MPAEAFGLPFRIPVRSGSRRRSRSKSTRNEPESVSRDPSSSQPSKSRSRSRNPSLSQNQSQGQSQSQGRASEPHRGLKRKYRSHDSSISPSQEHDERDTSFEESDAEPAPWTTCPPHEAKLHMPAEMVKQYDAAGLEYHKPLPGGSFPHADYKHRSGGSRSLRMRERDLRRALGKLNPPPLSTFQGQLPSIKSGSIKQRATASLITLMHTCLQRGDMQRADRAFSILLRLQIGNQALDLRKDGLWGVGAEILMHRDRPQRPLDKNNAKSLRNSGEDSRERVQIGRNDISPDRFDNSDAEDEAMREREARRERLSRFREQDERLPMPTAAALSKVREYYEHLIVQFPTSSRNQNTQISASDFYVAMYGLWLVHIDDAGEVERKLLRDRFTPNRNNTLGSTGDGQEEGEQSEDERQAADGHGAKVFDLYSLDDESRHAYSSGLQEIRAKQVLQATDLAQNIDGITSSFPYSDESRLVDLRASLERWLADLCVPHADEEDATGSAASLEPGSPEVTILEQEEGGEDDLSSDMDDGIFKTQSNFLHSTGSRRTTAEMVQRRDGHLRRARELAERAKELEDTLYLRVRN